MILLEYMSFIIKLKFLSEHGTLIKQNQEYYTVLKTTSQTIIFVCHGNKTLEDLVNYRCNKALYHLMILNTITGT